MAQKVMRDRALLRVTGFIIVIIFLVYYLGGLDRINYAFLNYFFHLRRPLEISKDIVVIGITDRCLTKLGRWPLNREHYVKLFKILKEGEAKVVGIDIIFSEPSGKVDFEIRELSKDIGGVIYPAYFNVDDGNLYFPVEPIMDGAFDIGHINITPAINGFVYSIPLVIPYSTANIQAFSIKISDTYLNRDINVPIDSNGNLIINYSGRRINMLSFSDVLGGKVPSDIFKGKLVLLGVTAKGVGDYYLAPSYNEPISGLEIHVNAVNTIITERFLKKIRKNITVLISLILCFLLIIFVSYTNPIRGSIAGLIGVFICIIGGFLLFLNGIIFDIAPTILSILSTIVSSDISSYIKEREEKDKIREIFQMYLSPEVVNKLLDHPELWGLKGEETEVTVMFVDISGFTKFSQTHKPQEVVEFLNRYFSIVTDIIFKYGGTLDKFIGDAVMAIYGAPVRYEDHRLKAIESALEIIDISRKNGIRVKIGINTGKVILGNIGTDKRVQYTAIGDAVNIAEFLESIGEPNEIIIGEETYRSIKDKVRAKEIILEGKYKGVRAYKIIEDKDDGG
ncbi:MAG TPA: adenylate/guanylate cyclase domain-containing protein [bacterium]|nr:adenylate/guanylate cyclase domain-containing protein [bacterium]